MVHRLRDCCDLLVIGGNTVRVDRPLLDARLCEGKAPDVLIYSRSQHFDATIPLFGVPAREVFVENHLKRIENHALVMIEGGQGMLDAVREDVQWYLIFRSPHKKEGTPIVLPSDLREVFSQKIGEDTMSWYVR
jgi:diaminohydroxyphosphoribosylaminopyrimidine deaminase/5-amino-6-(5-phosphoribosylamino)uracil reductase